MPEIDSFIADFKEQDNKKTGPLCDPVEERGQADRLSLNEFYEQ